MTRDAKQRLVCIALLTVGLSLVVGGLFFAPLLIAGVPIFVGGLGVLAAIVEDKDKIAFNTTINHINNYGGPGQQTISRERITARFNMEPSTIRRIGSWTGKMRDLMASAPSELQLKGDNAPILTFTHNYHMNDVPKIEYPKLFIEDVTSESSPRDRLSSVPELEATTPVSTILQI